MVENNRFDLVVDAVGSIETRRSASLAIKPGDVIVHIGLLEAEGGLDVRKMTLQEITFIGTYTYTHGDGYGHVAVCVDDCASEHARMRDLGLAPKDIKEFHRDGALMAQFFIMEDPDGYQIELLERHGQYG